jgi:hypothetical protein
MAKFLLNTCTNKKSIQICITRCYYTTLKPIFGSLFTSKTQYLKLEVLKFRNVLLLFFSDEKVNRLTFSSSVSIWIKLYFKAKLRYVCLQTHKTFRIVTRMAASHKVNCSIVLALQHGALNSSCFISKWKNLNWTFDVFILRLSAAICRRELTKLMTSTAVLPYFTHEAKMKCSSHFTRILSLYGKHFICTGIIFNHYPANVENRVST